MTLEWFNRVTNNIAFELVEICDRFEELFDDGDINIDVNRISNHPNFKLSINKKEDDGLPNSSITIYFDPNNNEFYSESYTTIHENVYKHKIIFDDTFDLIEYLHDQFHEILESQITDDSESFHDEILTTFAHKKAHALHILGSHPEKVVWLEEKAINDNRIEDAFIAATEKYNHSLYYQFGVIPELDIGVIRETNDVEPIEKPEESIQFQQIFTFELKHAQFLSMYFKKSFSRYMNNDLDDESNHEIGS